MLQKRMGDRVARAGTPKDDAGSFAKAGRDFSAREPARVFHSFSSILITSLSARAMQAIINEDGKGQGWLAMKRTSEAITPASSLSSRATASSTDSPTSTKPRQRRITSRRKARLPAEHDPALAFGEHDHDRIGAREMLCAAVGAMARHPARNDCRGRLALCAETMAVCASRPGSARAAKVLASLSGMVVKA